MAAFDFSTLRGICILLAFIPLLTVVDMLLSGIPPTYNDIWTYEAKLPQNNLTDLSTANARAYLRFPGHLWFCKKTMAYLAHLAGRVYVFEDYTWLHLPMPHIIYDFALQPMQIPLNVFVAGQKDSTPAAVEARYLLHCLPTPQQLATDGRKCRGAGTLRSMRRRRR
ncbi:hypothetical protein B0H14DRAFT_3462553 [Mycena olivaceomarginata]|nr:hypothetical protein B0H14DRAFT_3462553 [Mycena olivaceomarginata]